MFVSPALCLKTCCTSCLFLAQDEGPSSSDGVPGGQVLPWAFLHSVLIGLPDTIACHPRHAHVMPLPICHGYGQRHCLITQTDRDRPLMVRIDVLPSGRDLTPCGEMLFCFKALFIFIWIEMFTAFIYERKIADILLMFSGSFNKRCKQIFPMAETTHSATAFKKHKASSLFHQDRQVWW